MTAALLRLLPASRGIAAPVAAPLRLAHPIPRRPAIETPSLPPRTALRTLPEQIADQVGGEIVRGVIPAGSRLIETEIAATFGVSRAPVREAIRLLARRGLADFTPRRGAFVIEMTLDKFVDMFNVMVLLLGHAARIFAETQCPASFDHLRRSTEALERLADDPTTDPETFAIASWRLSDVLARYCGSDATAALLSHQLRDTAWGTVWRQFSLDFQTAERRRDVAQRYRARLEAVEAGDPMLAERLTREASLVARDHAVAALAAARGEQPDSRRLSATL